MQEEGDVDEAGQGGQKSEEKGGDREGVDELVQGEEEDGGGEGEVGDGKGRGDWVRQVVLVMVAVGGDDGLR